VFEEWNEVLKAYRASRPRYFQALFTQPLRLEKLPIWLCVILLTVLLTQAPDFHGRPVLLLGLAVCVALCMTALWLSREIFSLSYYQDLYRLHAIASQSSLKSSFTLRYALFLQRLQDSGMTATQAARLAEFAKICTPPPKSLNLSQSLVLIALVTFLAPLSIEVLKASESWNSGAGKISILVLVLLILIVLLVKALLSDHAHFNQRIIRYIELASHDLKKSTPCFRDRGSSAEL